MDARTLIIILLAVGVAVLGYLYYERSQSGISIKAPGVNIEAQ
jgi:branched-subunit amino acid ABC-type transport system permease component